MTEAEGRTLLRNLITEHDTAIVSDDDLDLYLDRGQEATNALIRYHQTDDTSISTASGTQEYTVPTDVLDIVWVEWNATMLKRTDQADLRRRGIDFRDVAAAAPEEYYLHGRKIGLYPKPNAIQTLRIRYVSTPAAYTDSAFAQLATQDHRLVVLYAAHLWLTAHGLDSNFGRAERFRQQFEREALQAKALYDARNLVLAPGPAPQQVAG